MKTKIQYFFILFLMLFIIQSCSKTYDTGNKKVHLRLGAFTVPKEAYHNEIIPAFKQYWKLKTGQTVTFEESYEASGSQARAIQAGFEADIAALSLEQDMVALKKAGLITHEWKNTSGGGFVTRSLVVIAYRPGNPKRIQGWEDLKRADISVLYPNPKTSGGAQWVLNAIYGAGLKLTEMKTGVANKDFPRDLLQSIQRRVKFMDTSGRKSVESFEAGVGDVVLTYENEALLRQKQGKSFPFVIPRATILIENPVALVDANIKKHNNREVAEAFLSFLYTKNIQRTFSRYGFRPVDKELAQELQNKYPVPEYLFDISYFGGWDFIQNELYGSDGVWTKIIQEIGVES